MRELCNDGVSVDGHVLTRRTVRTPRSAERLRNVLDVATLKSFHLLWDYKLWRAGSVDNLVMQTFRVPKVILPPVIVRPVEGEQPWVSVDRDGWAALKRKLQAKRGGVPTADDYSDDDDTANDMAVTITDQE